MPWVSLPVWTTSACRSLSTACLPLCCLVARQTMVWPWPEVAMDGAYEQGAFLGLERWHSSSCLPVENTETASNDIVNTPRN